MDNNINDNEANLINKGVIDILTLIEQDREKEIITRRFGLYDRKETLEQIGEILGITRERVRQLEKAILNKIRSHAANSKAPVIHNLEKIIIRNLSETGRISRIDNLADKIFQKTTNQQERAHITFIASLSPGLTLINETDDYYLSVAIADLGDEKQIRNKIEDIVNIVKNKGEPLKIDEIDSRLSYEHPSQVEALASTSKKLANLNTKWGLVKWPSVNPKNIRDKIFVILEDTNKPMHFADIAKSIQKSGFKRKDVTTQAIHNELIKDSRFVLIGRGIYALTSWGYSRGTVADIIENVLKVAGEPLHRDEIVRRVLKSRQVKETTILLNLQSKPQFKRVSKATYQFTPSN